MSPILTFPRDGGRKWGPICVPYLRPRFGGESKRGPFAGLELRENHALAAVVEYYFHSHADLNAAHRRADDVAAEARSFVKVNPGRDVWNVRRETAQGLPNDFADHREREDLTFSAQLHPFEFVACTFTADRSRAENPTAALLAFLHHQFAGFSALPKRLVNRSDFGQGLSNLFVRHIVEPF